jgi:hypothetical protein
LALTDAQRQHLEKLAERDLAIIVVASVHEGPVMLPHQRLRVLNVWSGCCAFTPKPSSSSKPVVQQAGRSSRSGF